MIEKQDEQTKIGINNNEEVIKGIENKQEEAPRFFCVGMKTALT